ncbi:hypothetical protein CEXT_180021 [Caerostris extrusa]|uniref:Uncharacterized protein n=1 Tax=Caerostris extrusa TaxID=172846 RepID=A0AAV4NKQ1_CAEEX|nr:hypothetical protein CEXT_180021 [Caerostris extrusa]
MLRAVGSVPAVLCCKKGLLVIFLWNCMDDHLKWEKPNALTINQSQPQCAELLGWYQLSSAGKRICDVSMEPYGLLPGVLRVYNDWARYIHTSLPFYEDVESSPDKWEKPNALTINQSQPQCAELFGWYQLSSVGKRIACDVSMEPEDVDYYRNRYMFYKTIHFQTIHFKCKRYTDSVLDINIPIFFRPLFLFMGRDSNIWSLEMEKTPTSSPFINHSHNVQSSWFGTSHPLLQRGLLDVSIEAY